MESRKSAAAQYRDVVVVLEVAKLVNDTSASGYARKKRLCGNLITQNERNSGFGLHQQRDLVYLQMMQWTTRIVLVETAENRPFKVDLGLKVWSADEVSEVQRSSALLCKPSKDRALSS